MNNRNIHSPILCALVLSLGSLLSKAETASSVAPGPAAQPSPATQLGPVATSNSVAGAAKPNASIPHTGNYTVVKGDSLTSVARKFNTTRKKLKALNNLAESKITPGQVLLVPATKIATAAAKAKARHDYEAAQPVQDFDVPASTFASCPVPLPPGDDDGSTTPSENEKPAPVAKLVSPAEAAAAEAALRKAAAREAAMSQPVAEPTVATAAPVTSSSQNTSSFSASATSNKHLAKAATAAPAPAPSSSNALPPAPIYNPPTARLSIHTLNPNGFFPGANRNGYTTAAASDWGSRFLQAARNLGDKGLEYDDDWRPPGESHSWTMDCSNTSRYLYRVAAGLELPRTASDQYYYLHLQGKAWDVPLSGNGLVDNEYLRHRLKPGDLLFWENTYKPERQPPITHVMVFLGTNNLGQWIMAGSQSSRGGEHNRRNGGPDVYVFRPWQPCGGYSTWMGMVHHKGRFCAFGRPLEADPTKLSVATDN